MNLKALFEKYTWLTLCTGLEVKILDDNNFHFNWCTISVKNDHLEIVKKGEASGKLPMVINKVPVGLPIAVVITGKGVLVKSSKGGTENINDNPSSIFPGLQADSFFIQGFKTGIQQYAAVIRKETASRLAASLTASGAQVLSLSIGPFVVNHVIDQFNHYGNEFIFNGHCIKHNAAFEWQEYNYQDGISSEFPIKIDREVLPENYVLAYATAFQLALYKQLHPLVIESAEITNERSEYEYKKKFQFRLVIFLIPAFLLLLANFFALSYYNKSNENLLTRANLNTATSENMKKAEKEADAKSMLLARLGWSGGISYAWLCDQVAQTVPGGVSFNTLIISPTPKDGQKLTDTRIIKVSGNIKEINILNTWIYSLREKAWVKRVILNSYGPSVDDSLQEFALTIYY